MKSSKNIRFLERTFLMLALIGCFSFVVLSCSKDDEANSIDRNLLFGSWLLERENGSLVDYFLEIELQSDGDFSQTFIDGSGIEIDFGTWSLSGTRVTIDFDDGDELVADILTLTAEKLIIRADDEEFEFEKD